MKEVKTMKKINEIFTVNEGFFTQLFADNQNVYNELFEGFNPQMLNANFLALCGTRYIAPVVTVAQTMKALTDLILATYYQSWQRVHMALFANYDIINPIKISITTDREMSSDKSSNSEDTEKRFITPFEEESEDVKAGSNEANSVNTVANKEITTQTVTREGNTTGKPSELIQAEIQTRKITFLSLVLNDIKEYCTLQIY